MMKRCIKIVQFRILALSVALFCFLSDLHADNLRQISSAEGITNNSILCLAQDNRGLIYLGTCDGLDIWNGSSMSVVPMASERQGGLSGNLIEKFIPLEDDRFWVRTSYGLDLMEKGRVVENHGEFSGIYYVCSSSKENTVVLTLDNRLMGYDSSTDSFIQVRRPLSLDYASYLAFWTSSDSNQVVFIVKNGIYSTKFVSGLSSVTELAEPERLLEKDFIYAFSKEDVIFLIDSAGGLYTFDPREHQLSYCADLSRLIRDNGPVSDIIYDGDDMVVSFLFDGMVRLRSHPVMAQQYTVEPMNIGCGVFSLMKDARQDIIWIATDGQGLYMYSKDNVTLRGYAYSDLPYDLSKPVRSILKDSRNNLWVATKGEGILYIRDFSSDASARSLEGVSRLDEAQGLSNLTVYALEESSRGLVYVGTEGNGIDYWSYSDRRFHRLGGNVPEDLKWVHSIYESHPDTLWVATVGCGVFRLDLYPGGGRPRVKSSRKLDFDFKTSNNDFFFAMYPDRDGTLYFGNRGGGMVHYDPVRDRSEIITFDQGRNKLANDVWAIIRGVDGSLWIGTSYGLLRLDREGKVEDTPIRHTVHGLLEDAVGDIWVTTNIGLFCYSPASGTYRQYGYSYGIETIEYSDGAAFRDGGGTLFFGGTNGFVCMERTGHAAAEYEPELLFHSAKVNDVVMDIPEDGRIVVGPDSRLNSVTMLVIDYVNTSDYLFSYNIEGLDARWTSTQSEISFTTLPYGKYVLNVRYVNTATGYRSPVVSLELVIEAPWYATGLAKVIYILISGAVVALFGHTWARRRKMKKQRQMERMQAKFEEESLVSRLHVMENFSRELSSPITMISALSQQLMGMSEKDGDRHEFLKKLMDQSKRLSRILSTFHYFSESNDMKQNVSAKMFSVSELASGIHETYLELASQKNVSLAADIPEDLLWSTDPKRLAVMIDLLMTNALVNSESGTSIGLMVSHKDGDLLVRVSNYGIWLTAEEAAEIFDKFTVMEHFNRKSETGESFQDEMRLAICYNLTVSLGGVINYREEDGNVVFEISIPQGSESAESSVTGETAETLPHELEANLLLDKTLIEEETLDSFDHDNSRQWMFILGTDAGIVNVVAGVFSSDYNVKAYHYISDFSEGLRRRQPDVIICENLNLRQDIAAVISALKKDKKTFRTPVIMLTAMRQVDDAVSEGIADVCIPVPFNVKYLKSTVRQSLNRIESLKDYFSSSVSAYEFCEGKMLHREDKEFIEKLFEIIWDNISNSEITTSAIAEKMGVSLRRLYHRLENSINVTPSNILKEYRLLYAEKLLVTTKMSIDEIIYKAGFANRGTFFKNFSAKYGCTPKQYRKDKAVRDNEMITS